MPYTIHRETKGILWVFTGEVSDQEMITSYKEFYDNHSYEGIQYLLTDYSGVTNFNVRSDTIYNMGQIDKDASAKYPHIKVAIIATSQLLKGMTRMWELSGGSTSWDSKIFEDEASAREWLNC